MNYRCYKMLFSGFICQTSIEYKLSIYLTVSKYSNYPTYSNYSNYSIHI